MFQVGSFIYMVIVSITIAAKFKDMNCPDLNLSTDLIKKNICMPIFNDPVDKGILGV